MGEEERVLIGSALGLLSPLCLGLLETGEFEGELTVQEWVDAPELKEMCYSCQLNK